jgi:uncharacterized membrane protein YfcA
MIEPSIIQFILFGVVILATHFLEGITGFGCTALALPFCILIVGIKLAVPTLVILAWILALYIVVIDYKNIVWKEFLRIITFVGIGLPIGMVIYSYLPETLLKKFLGVFMIIVSLRGLYVCFGGTSKLKLNPIVLNVILFLGGIIHGAFGTGGPFIIIYAANAIPKKSNFRATLCTLWLALNTVIITKNFATGAINRNVIILLLVCMPFLFAGMLIGNKAHNKVDDELFTRLVYAVLLLSGLFMLI